MTLESLNDDSEIRSAYNEYLKEKIRWEERGTRLNNRIEYLQKMDGYEKLSTEEEKLDIEKKRKEVLALKKELK